jgi:hypothetical protein
MNAPAPWKCPDCSVWVAPHVSEHRCEPPEAGVSVRPVVAPYSPSTGTYTWPTGSGFVVTGGGTYSSTICDTGGGGGGGSSGVQDWLSVAPMPPGWGERAA